MKITKLVDGKDPTVEAILETAFQSAQAEKNEALRAEKKADYRALIKEARLAYRAYGN